MRVSKYISPNDLVRVFKTNSLSGIAFIYHTIKDRPIVTVHFTNEQDISRFWISYFPQVDWPQVKPLEKEIDVAFGELAEEMGELFFGEHT